MDSLSAADQQRKHAPTQRLINMGFCSISQQQTLEWKQGCTIQKEEEATTWEDMDLCYEQWYSGLPSNANDKDGLGYRPRC